MEKETGSVLAPYVIFDASGMIAQTGHLLREHFSLQKIEDGWGIIEGVGSPELNYVSDGQIMAYTAEEISARNNIAPGWAWKMPERMAVDVRSLDDAKEQAWRRIKAMREIAEAEPFVCDGAIYDSNRDRIGAGVQSALLAQLASEPFEIEWTLADNTVKLLDGPGMMEVGKALGERNGVIFAEAKRLRDRIDACASVAEADAVLWPE